MLYLIATPIGNRDDISLRALEVLRSVDTVACEDTRDTGILLKHHEIKCRLLSFHEHNEEKRSDQLIEMLERGQSVAVVSDRGTPGISDPGFRLVRKAIDRGLELTHVPGAAAFLPALVLSGLPVHSFVFRGFPPNKKGKRRRFIEVDRELPYTLIYYESPHRLLKFLTDALEVLGDRDAAVANDLTKTYEHIYRGPLSQVLETLGQQKIKGEFTVVIRGADARQPAGASLV